MNFKKWVKSIQTAGYNGARTVYKICYNFQIQKRTVSAETIWGNTVLMKSASKMLRNISIKSWNSTTRNTVLKDKSCTPWLGSAGLRKRWIQDGTFLTFFYVDVSYHLTFSRIGKSAPWHSKDKKCQTTLNIYLIYAS